LTDWNIHRQVRQRLEALRRAGVDRIPRPPDPRTLASEAIEAPASVVEEPPQAPVVAPKPEPAVTPTPATDVEPVPVARLHVAGSLFGEPEPEPEALGPFVPTGERAGALEVIAREVAGCPKCPVLVASRTHTVFGEGSPTARLMFIGEAPGAQEDASGRPFVGRAGALLNDMITKGMGLRRDEVYIANILKCRPPENRAPMLDEVAHCIGYLHRQLAIIRPEFLCLLGRTAATALLDTNLAMGKLRGRWHIFRGIRTLVTFHPAYLLRNPDAKRDTWADLKLLMVEMGLTPPRAGRTGA
jgi:uracil-DNA glycosylase family 4